MSLHLTRYKGEAIKIGENTTVRIGKIRNNAVTLLIDAPREVAVDRIEIYQKKRLHRLQEKPTTNREFTE